MSSAPQHPVSRPPARAERVPGHRWERILATLIVCLPIPVLAATGLSIPLPAGVERIAATLVAWADEGESVSPLGESGEVVLAGAEQAAPERLAKSGASLYAGADRTAGESSGSTPTSGAGGGGPKEKDDGGGGGGGGGGGSDPGGEDPNDEPDLVEGAVEEVSKTMDSVVDEVEGALDDLATTDDILPGLGG